MSEALDWRKDPAAMERWWTKLAKTVAVDFDGTLHPYTAGWVGSVPADEPPIDGAEEFLAKLFALEFTIVVFSARADHPEGLSGIVDWLERYGLADYVDRVTHEKVAAVAYVDDRAVPFLGCWDDVLLDIDRLVSGRPHGAAPR